ncbi:GDP-L-fucose synthase [Alphaproteobacteria bacterium]|nr:GDP-L-fucose synthase [Alphaproteobacteria bacterium]
MITIFVAGHNGMVGSAIVRQLSKRQNIKLLLASRLELDLTDSKAVLNYMQLHRPDQVYIAAAKVGGIYSNNTYPAEFITENLAIQINLIQSSFKVGVRKLLFLGSSCIYPRYTKQPIREECLLSGLLEPTNEPYAIAKIAGIKMCESYNRQYGLDYRCVMPSNLYGENDNFHPLNSHVIPAMMQRFHEAKLSGSRQVLVWGTGKPRREFLHVDDMAAACVYVMDLSNEKFVAVIPNMMCAHINIGIGYDVTIAELASMMAEVVGFKGNIKFDTSREDGTPQKLMDVSRISSLGWKYSIELQQGLSMTYEWFLDNLGKLRG